jgi:peroxiredoxin Q/BCP
MTNAHRVVSMLLATGVLLAPLVGAAAELAVGDVAPGFEMQGSDGKTYKLEDLLSQGGSHGVVLSWFPMAFTSG